MLVTLQYTYFPDVNCLVDKCRKPNKCTNSSLRTPHWFHGQLETLKVFTINSVQHPCYSSHSSFGTGDFDFIFFSKRADVWNPPFMSMQLLPKCYIRWDANVAFTFSNFHIKQHLISLWSYYYNTQNLNGPFQPVWFTRF